MILTPWCLQRSLHLPALFKHYGLRHALELQPRNRERAVCANTINQRIGWRWLVELHKLIRDLSDLFAAPQHDQLAVFVVEKLHAVSVSLGQLLPCDLRITANLDLLGDTLAEDYGREKYCEQRRRSQ